MFKFIEIMEVIRSKFSPQLRANVANVVIKERYTLAKLAEYCHDSGLMISRWKKEFLENRTMPFGGSSPERKRFMRQPIEYPKKFIGNLCRKDIKYYPITERVWPI